MRSVTGFVMLALVFCSLGMSRGNDDPLPQPEVPQPMVIGDLEPQLNGKEVTIKFTITGLDGIAQQAKEGQAPSFAIETDNGKQKNELSVCIEGELANVLDRLQMAAFQDNPLKAGTTIIATGKLAVHKTSPNQYLLKVTKWQGFRVLPTKEEK